MFREHVGIDYSGAGPPDEPCAGLRVFRSAGGDEPVEVRAPGPRARCFSRRALAEWLDKHLRGRGPIIVGIDHCFSFPKAYLDRRGLRTWDGFLDDLHRHWPTDRERVEACRPGNPCCGSPDEFRLCDTWTSSAKSVFLFDVNGSVAKSSFAGIPWLRRIRRALRGAVHFWPYDGWRPPPGRSVVAEVYPSILRHRFPREGRDADQQDAYAVAQWLRTRDAMGALAPYFEPNLAGAERRIAKIEGWVLGIL